MILYIYIKLVIQKKIWRIFENMCLFVSFLSHCQLHCWGKYFNRKENTVWITRTPDNGKRASTWGRKHGLDRMRAEMILKQILLDENRT
jgi:hypothetical protein